MSEIAAAMDEHSNAVLAAKMSRSYRIRVSNTKKPIVFYLNLAKKYINRYHKVELTALGMAIPTVVIISEILKENGMAIQKMISISTIKTKDEFTGKSVQKAKIEIVMEKSQKTDESEKPKTKTMTLKKRTNKRKTKVKKQKKNETGTAPEITPSKFQEETIIHKDDVKNVDTVVAFVRLSLSDSSESADSMNGVKNEDGAMIEGIVDMQE